MQHQLYPHTELQPVMSCGEDATVLGQGFGQSPPKRMIADFVDRDFDAGATTLDADALAWMGLECSCGPHRVPSLVS